MRDGSRPVRLVEAEGATYNVIVRGNEQQAIFREDADRREYLRRLARYRKRFGNCKARILVLTLAFLFPVAALAQPASRQGRTWITNVKIVSPERLDQIQNGSVLIENGRIVSVVRDRRAKKPKGATAFSGGGLFLVPGLIDSHVHLTLIPGMDVDQARGTAWSATAPPNEREDVDRREYPRRPARYREAETPVDHALRRRTRELEASFRPNNAGNHSDPDDRNDSSRSRGVCLFLLLLDDCSPPIGLQLRVRGRQLG